jgi:hypothetical protein
MLTCESCGDILEKNWKTQSRINSMLKDEISKTQYLVKKKLINLSQPNKLTTQVMDIIELNKSYISKIIFYLVIRQ